ncbi:hypothetical protein NMG60_11030819 [Bertholletia excelsa]
MVEPAHNLTLKPNTATSPPTTIKFLCSYGGRIHPRLSDGKLRYHGGETRVLSVDRSISFAELLVKLGELCGSSVMLRCQLPTEDLDALVSITSDEDVANLIEEYDRAAVSIKIRAFLSPPKSAKKISPPPSINAASASLDAAGSPRSLYSIGSSSRFPDRFIHSTKPVAYQKPTVVKVPYHHHAYYVHHGKSSHLYLIHNGNHWQ